MEIAIALLALLVGAALGWFIAQARTAATSERARLATEQVGKLDAELTALRARATELEAERGALKEAQSKLIESFKALSADALPRMMSNACGWAAGSLSKALMPTATPVLSFTLSNLYQLRAVLVRYTVAARAAPPGNRTV